MTSTHPEDYDRDDVDQPVLPTQQPEPVSDSNDDADEQPATANPDAKS